MIHLLALSGLCFATPILTAPVQEPNPEPAAATPAPQVFAPTVMAADQESVLLKEWLVIAPTDRRGRRPFSPNAVFAKHLLDPASPPPKAGETLVGELGTEQAWTRRAADANGTVSGRALSAAYTQVDCPRDEVLLADLDGALTVWVNGVPQVGDMYGMGMGGLPVPVRKGVNHVYVTGVRGGMRLELTRPPAALLLNPFDVTRPDLEEGSSPVGVEFAVLLVNASDQALSDIAVDVGSSDADALFELEVDRHVERLGPRECLKVLLEVPSRRTSFRLSKVPVPIQAHAGDPVLVHSPPSVVEFEVKSLHEAHREVYVSSVDGSLQQYAVLPPTDWKANGLVLTLHGAGVDCLSQVAAYSPKSDFWIVAPTNRRPFGFDWQDWGRRDALDVLEIASHESRIDDLDHVFLTGHSMGGHGTWHLAANDPFLFAAIAPSAGWASFDTYGGGRTDDGMAALWKGADGPSRTLDLIDNLKQLPIYVLHGSADDNVPASEARTMLAALEKAGAKPEQHFQEGAGHWWDGDAAPGADCVDWPPLFELFRKSKRADSRASFSFTTLDPAVLATHQWVTLVQVERQGEPARVEASWNEDLREARVTTSNVRTLRLADPGRAPFAWIVDGQEFEIDREDRTRERMRHDLPRLFLTHTSGTWTPTNWESLQPQKHGLGPWQPSCGPFKRAFDNGFVLVYGTGGDDREDRELYERARQDAATWWYRGNGRALVMSDRTWLEDLAEPTSVPYRGWPIFGTPTFGLDGDSWLDELAELPEGSHDFFEEPKPAVTTFLIESHGNVILYGNADTNAAWERLVGPACPIQARRGSIRVGAREIKGDALGAAFIRPCADGTDAMVGVFADTGLPGIRLGYTLSPFISGVGYPDYAVFSNEILTKGDGGVLAAGWFTHDWKLPEP